MTNRPVEEELEARVRQKEAVARLGMSALSGVELPLLLDEAVRLVADNLSVEYCKVLELLPDGDQLLLKAGVGWKEGYVGRATVGTNLESQAGYTLISDGPVIVENLQEEIRFKGAPLLHEHGVTSGITAAIKVEGHFYGVLGAHTRQRRSFTTAEARFLEDVADVLGAAIERKLSEEHARLAITERTERAEAAEHRFRFLAEANALLSASSLDYAMTLTNAARLAVPALADWCLIDVVETGGNVQRLVVGSAGSGEKALVEELYGYTLNPNLSHGTPLVLRTGRSELVPGSEDGALVDVLRKDKHLRRLNPRSYICVPLQVRRRLVGAMSLVSTESERRYGPDDLALAEGLAHCTALAIDNALYHVPETEIVRELVRRAKHERTVAPSSDGKEAPELTRRQLEVLKLLAEGKSAREISQQLYRSEATVRNHIRAVKHALEARSQLEAIARARKMGLLSG